RKERGGEGATDGRRRGRGTSVASAPSSADTSRRQIRDATSIFCMRGLRHRSQRFTDGEWGVQIDITFNLDLSLVVEQTNKSAIRNPQSAIRTPHSPFPIPHSPVKVMAAPPEIHTITRINLWGLSSGCDAQSSPA